MKYLLLQKGGLFNLFDKKGKKTYANGDEYEGYLDKNGIPHGKGKRTYKNGDIYEGNFNNGEINGKGKITYTDGEIYEGNFNNGGIHGKGKITYTDGEIYEGNFNNNGRIHGKGKITYKNGDIYEGNLNYGEKDSRIFDGDKGIKCIEPATTTSKDGKKTTEIWIKNKKVDKSDKSNMLDKC